MRCNTIWSWFRPIAAAAITSVFLIGPVAIAAAQDTPVSIIADQVRTQGFQCNNPSSAERLEAESAPNETVYLLKCEGVTYRVVLVPDMAAQVTPVE